MKKVRVIVAVVAAALMVMGVGYALWSQDLNITVNGSVGTFNVYIDPAGASSSDEGAVWDFITNQRHPTAVTVIASGLFYPGRLETYTVTVKNAGTLDAKLDGVVITGSHPIVQCSWASFGTANGMVIGAGQSKTITVTTQIPLGETRNATIGGDFSFTVTPSFSQINP